MIDFAQWIGPRMAAHAAAEAAEQLPLARACRALDTLRDVLPLLSGQDRADVLDGLRALVGEQDDRSWELTQDLSAVPW